jgi:PST family polysaccharide transporter
MKSVFRATAILGGSSFVTIIVGVVTSKAYALLIGPSGIGMFGLLQSLAGLSGMIAGLGVGTGVVRIGANALARDAAEEVAALRRAAWVIIAGAGCLSFLVLLFCRAQISQYMLGSVDHKTDVVLMGFVLLLNLAVGVQTSLLNAHHRVGALAKLAIINSVTTGVAGIALVSLMGDRGLAWGLVTGAAMSLTASTVLLRREVVREAISPTPEQVWKTSLTLLRFGLPYTASLVVGGGVQLLLPVVVLRLLGKESVGYYRAATAVSVGYVGFLLTAMSQDYYPRISAASHQPEALVRLVNEQLRLVLLLGVPLILCAMTFTPYLVPLIYSAQFNPTVTILEWQLAGNLLKFTSWTMSFAILARSGGLTFFLVELVAGIASLCSVWFSVKWLGLSGLGVAFLLTYAVYFLTVWLVVRQQIKFYWWRCNKLVLALSFIAVLLIQGATFIADAEYKLVVSSLLVVASVTASVLLTWREVGAETLLRVKRIWGADHTS